MPPPCREWRESESVKSKKIQGFVLSAFEEEKSD
jgi:hypothetical protein